jgi:sortase A
MVEHLPAAALRVEGFFAGVRRQLQKYGIRQVTSAVLLCSGLALVIYVVASYSLMYAGQRRLMQEWQTENATLTTSTHGESGLTRLVIPRIDLDVVIVEGTSHHALSLGPGHLQTSALPGGPGNSVIAAHRDTFFRHVYQLKPGDDIFVERGGQKYHYVVTSKRIVQPTDLSVLDASSESRLTLITCYPIHFIGPAPERLIVFAKLVHEV